MARYPVERLPAFYDALIERLRALPGVESASLSLNSPLNGNQWNGSFFVEAAARGEKGQEVYAWWTRVTSDYFRTLGMKLRYGRLLQPTDGANAIRVAVVNETFVRKYLANSNPLERRISRDEGRPSVQIVGVIADAKYQDANVEAPAMVFLSILQSEPGNTPESIRAQLISQYAQNLEVRATGDPARLSDSVRQVLHEIAPDVPITQIQTLDQQIDRSLSQQRLITYLAGGFGLLAVTMACIGLYGTMSYSVGRRTKEVGVRMALGAQPRDILREVTAQGAGLALAGIVIGIVAAVGAARLVASQLYGIAPTDLITFAGAVLLLAVVALIACLIPARRATRVDPMVALRYE
jgi:predicted permease